MPNLLHAGQAVKRAQSFAGISNAEFARLAETSPQQVISWRTQANMKLHTIQIICKALGVTLASFLELN